MDNTSEKYWQVYILNASLDGASFQLTTYKIIFDTGSSMVFLPSLEYKMFIDKVIRQKECE